jgi:hypothetical protein
MTYRALHIQMTRVRVAKRLASWGYEVSNAGSPAEGAAKVKKHY